ncbi:MULTISPECIES: type I DNA topoisomerase [Ruminococcus]|uniref:DNA topoisomerase 1 n=1 Tax=Ruminococcus albus 8 TaxID=246199 RepID=E9S873_RUMAL|nr:MULTISPECIES: type I DNA topoisomerase [Ruminococcus]MBE6873913.1 type I DNA topoisomerase [Ruminococcus albus]EGC04681.1 DNA topoisomerase I [Ruminococcus albus 8]MBQ9541270.1 type I DNA topoisomerase [Ruminococcus sp.]MBR0530631.1 type I DNA topoisomerase [Ruminococcus sp.]MCC3351270.1 type I DNA topoisomerase [Ruminococcus albus 8]
MSDLVIVESPHKAKTVKRYLSGDYEVVASMGHLRDLPKSKLGVDIENDFEPQYINIKDKESLIKEIKKKAKASDHVYLAGDPDREGEAISWHLAQLLGLDMNDKNRVTFNEITKSGIDAGMSSPRTIDMDLVNAQQARRILDRIVGYKLSPFLWRKIRRGLSAGRVQSVAVKMICDRENEIRAFVSQEYWSIDAQFTAKSSKKPFAAKVDTVDGAKPELKCKADADAVLARLEGAEFVVSNVKKSVRKKNPAAPFTTSTLQQEASRRLGFQGRRTMKAAQELYEGLEVNGMGATGLITYMRTDSLRISDEARAAAYDFIKEKYGENYVPDKPRVYKTKGSAQDAHEAIRPTNPAITPDLVKASGVTNDQYKLYKLIWERFIASQMAGCTLDTMSVDIEAKGVMFKATGYSVKFDGFTVLYEESKDEEEEKKNVLPPLVKGDKLDPKEILGNQHFTQPPPRYTEATLVKAFEETGIGRPSTYVTTVTTIINRNYVERDGKQLKPTSLGEVTNELMSEHFDKIVDVKFTANMEKSLDDVESGKTGWVKTLQKFYKEFDKELTEAEKEMEGKRVKVPDEATDEICELCGKPMVIKIGRFGKFMACSGFPDCKNTKRIVMETGGDCPFCGKRVLLKKSKKGKKYYGCENNPECSFMTWDIPTEEKCPRCGSTLFQKGGKNGILICHKPDCGYQRNLSGENTEGTDNAE